MKHRINRQATYIFPEVYNVILTSEEIENIFDRKLTINDLRKMTKDEVFEAWLNEATEWTRFHICEDCNQIHSRTFESCEEKSEFKKFYQPSKTVWLDCVK